jgi:beta-glucosidase
MKALYLVFAALLLGAPTQAQKLDLSPGTEQRIDSLLAIMTLEEKLGQLTVIAFSSEVTGPEGDTIDIRTALSKGHVGGIQNIRGVDRLRPLQEMVVNESRLGIPLIFPSDIIHGSEVVFPIPLAEASSWDLEAIERASRIAATEATAQGITMNFAPMADIARDPRWGRMMEGGGEDPFLTSHITAARVRGYQGDDLSDPSTMVGCVKHFAAYGAAEGGRDYNIVDMSERRLREVYLPPFESAVHAGVGSIMVSFNEINGVPASSNEFLLKDILRDEWGFNGFVIGDYTSVGELVEHGVAEDLSEAAQLAMNAGLDVDLVTQAFLHHIEHLMETGGVSVDRVDEAVRRMLRIKFALGLMDDPYRYLDKAREESTVYRQEYLDIARDMARKSIVLLKNDNNVLPLETTIGKLALVGPFIDNRIDPKGEWAFGGSHYEDIVTMLAGIQGKVSEDTQILYAKGCNTNDDSVEYFDEAMRIADQADVVVVGVGEPISMVGEGHSRTNLDLPGVQLDLLKELRKTGKPIIAILLSGRPLLLDWLEHNVEGIIQAWHLGHESGHAIADVLFGDYNPSGKLTVSFPLSVGQIPVYYSHKTTGRPFQEDLRWCSHYIDSPNTPLYPFGYGLSYSSFEYSEIYLSHSEISPSDTLTATVRIRNAGPYDGSEIVQLYIRDMKGSVTRPVKQLRGFEKIFLRSGEEQEVAFTITVEDLKFYDLNMDYVAEPGRYRVFIGKNSVDVREQLFALR